MKILLLSLITIVSFGNVNKDTNKKLHKAIEKEYKIDDFHLNKFDMPLSIAKEFSDSDNFFRIKTSVSLIGYAYTGRVYSCRSGNCKLSSCDNGEERQEYFDYLILYSKDLNIKKVKILSYNATYGQEICSKLWLKRFTKNNIQKKLKANEDINIISGATISSNALIKDINKVNATLSKLLKL